MTRSDTLACPPMLYGTAWKEEDTAAHTTAALNAGFRGIDTANQRKHYHEAGVGVAVREFLAHNPRSALFLQTKFTYPRGQDHRLPYDPAAAVPTQVRQSFTSSLEHLGVDHLDSMLLHGPELNQGLSIGDLQVWRTLEALHDEGAVGRIGVSNVSAEQLRELIAQARVAPAFVQNRCYADRGFDRTVREICAENHIVYQGFSLLTANRTLWADRRVHAIARALDCTPAQVILRFAIHLGILPLTGTTDPAHMRADLECLKLEISEAQLAALAGCLA